MTKNVGCGGILESYGGHFVIARDVGEKTRERERERDTHTQNKACLVVERLQMKRLQNEERVPPKHLSRYA